MVGCGRLGFETSASNGTGDSGGDAIPALIDAAPRLSCSNYTTLDACRREPGCTPKVCNDCPCDAPTMVGCVGRGDTAVGSCPTTPCSGCCTSTGASCGGMRYCLAPDELPQCGICNAAEPACVSNNDCVDSTCAPFPCSCGTRMCQQITCTDDSACSPAEYCSIAGYCLSRHCASTADCPADFACANNDCVRQSCLTDGECSAFCVNGQCYSGRGTCTISPI